MGRQCGAIPIYSNSDIHCVSAKDTPNYTMIHSSSENKVIRAMLSLYHMQCFMELLPEKINEI